MGTKGIFNYTEAEEDEGEEEARNAAANLQKSLIFLRRALEPSKIIPEWQKNDRNKGSRMTKTWQKQGLPWHFHGGIF